MKGTMKRRFVLGLAGVLTAVSLFSAVPASANASCTVGEGGFCGQELRSITRGGFTNSTLASEFGSSATSINSDGVTRRDFDRAVGFDRFFR